MNETQGYKRVKNFLTFNEKNFSRGHVFDEEFYIEYFVAEELRFKGKEVVNFNVQHPEFGKDIQIPNLDEKIYHTAFSPYYQDYYFDQDNNILVIEQNNTKNKYGKPYRIKIHG